MPAAEPLSLLANGVAEKSFANEPFLRRLAKVARLEPDALVLQLASGDGSLGLLLAQTLSCKVVIVDCDAERLAGLAKASIDLSLGSRVETRRASIDDLGGDLGRYRAVLAMGHLGISFQAAAEKLRGLLAPDGRLCRVYPVRVGMGAGTAEWSRAWQMGLGEPLPSPAELLGSLERAGFEPESVESLSDAELEAVFQLAPPGQSEKSLFPGPRVSPRASFAVTIGRRREPGEKPPQTSDRG